ncbi:MAG TPA: NUDIX domain-containing protein [Candidatus Nanoarchaeia archaeon]|nr:NUDIX domain-containing protein [Candidatus Nanoarchaeia archaeon]
MAQSPTYPEPCVGGLVLNPEQKILLIKSEKWFGKYVLPGGHIELGETMEQALQREMREETGLDVFDMSEIALRTPAMLQLGASKRFPSMLKNTPRPKGRGVFLTSDFSCSRSLCTGRNTGNRSISSSLIFPAERSLLRCG